MLELEEWEKEWLVKRLAEETKRRFGVEKVEVEPISYCVDIDKEFKGQYKRKW